MHNIEGMLPVAAVIVVGAMMINGVTVSGLALVTSIGLFFYMKIKDSQN